MRTHKYRAYIKSLNEVVMVDSISYDFETYEIYRIGINEEDLNYVSYHGKDDVILMQYIGKQDKNGIEVCEGDIIRTTHGTLFEVYFSAKHLAYFISSRFDTYYFTVLDSFEIVGNIYENPEYVGDLNE